MSLISYLTRVHFADNALEDALPTEIVRHAIRRPLILSDAEATGPDELNRLFDALPATVAPEMRVADGSDSTSEARRGIHDLLVRADCDAVIGFGGACALDLARQIGTARFPVITIPTRPGAIGLGPVTGRKSGIPKKQPMVPVAILCDATLTLNAAPDVTAAAGMDTLIHCLESYLSTTFNPPADGIALDGIRRAAGHVEAAVQDGRNILARREMLAAALNAGLAAEKGLGGIEAAANGLEAETKMHHGSLHGALLTEVLSFNAPAISGRFGLARQALGLSAKADVAEHLVALAARIGLPRRLSTTGLKLRDLPGAARRAAADPANCTNPRLATPEDYERMMRAAF